MQRLLVAQLRHAANSPETKPFYLTTEWWLHALMQLLLWVGALPTTGLPDWGQTGISFAALIAYMLSRGIAKSGVAFKAPLIPQPMWATLGVNAEPLASSPEQVEAIKAAAEQAPEPVFEPEPEQPTVAQPPVPDPATSVPAEPPAV